MMNETKNGASAEREQFGQLLKYTISGYGFGLFFAGLLDYIGFQRSIFGQWLVRTLAGEGESIFEGLFVFRKRLFRAPTSMVEAYGWGKFLGLAFPWFIDFGSRLAGVNVYGVEGFFIPYFYALSDQIGANISGLVFLRKKDRSWKAAVSRYLHHPVMLSSLAIVLIAPFALFLARLFGFSPTTQMATALETIAANLCWIPPLVGWLKKR